MNEQRGFTLVELLVSLAILSVALGVLFGAISQSLDRARKERDDATAVSLVQSLLARAQANEVQGAGTYPGGYRWQVTVKPTGTDDDAKARRMSAFEVRATVSWGDGAQEHSRTLSALRLVPLPPAPQQ